MNYSTFIFDFDLTLIDASSGIIASFKHAFEKLGLAEPDDERVRKTIGLTLEEAFEELTSTSPNPQSTLFRQYFVEKANDVMVESTFFLEGARDVLLNLKTNSRKIAIVTTKYRYRTEATLEKLKAADLVDLIIGGEDVENAKPHPEGLLSAISRLGSDKKKVLYIGDSHIDAKTARAAEIDFCAVTTGTTTADDFDEFPHKYIVKDMLELLSIINKKCGLN